MFLLWNAQTQKNSASGGRNRRNNKHITENKLVKVVLTSRGRKNMSNRKFIQVYRKRLPVRLKLATSSDLLIISKETWEKIGKPKMEKNYHEACDVSCAKLERESITNCNISFRGKIGKVKDFEFIGGDWLQFLTYGMNLLIQVCQSVKFANKNIGILKKKMKQKYQDLLTGELGICTKAKKLKCILCRKTRNNDGVPAECGYWYCSC